MVLMPLVGRPALKACLQSHSSSENFMYHADESWTKIVDICVSELPSADCMLIV